MTLLQCPIEMVSTPSLWCQHHLNSINTILIEWTSMPSIMCWYRHDGIDAISMASISLWWQRKNNAMAQQRGRNQQVFKFMDLSIHRLIHCQIHRSMEPGTSADTNWTGQRRTVVAERSQRGRDDAKRTPGPHDSAKIHSLLDLLIYGSILQIQQSQVRLVVTKTQQQCDDGKMTA